MSAIHNKEFGDLKVEAIIGDDGKVDVLEVRYSQDLRDVEDRVRENLIDFFPDDLRQILAWVEELESSA